MDSLTHTVLGACVGEAIAGKKLGKQAMLWGALANNLPDIDVLTSLWMNQPDSLLAHRGFTHSFLFIILISPLLAFVFSRWYMNKSTFSDWLLIFGTGNLIHIFIDALTAYGTGWFEPFSHKRISFNVLFVADPVYTIVPLLCFIVMLFIPRKKVIRRKLALAGIYCSSLYICFAVINKIKVDNKMQSELKKQNIQTTDYFTSPTPLNCLLWSMVAKYEGDYKIGYYSVFDKREHIPFTDIPSNENLLSTLPQDLDLEKLKRFAKGYYAVEKVDGQIYFSDIRFGQVEGWKDEKAPFVFKYVLDKNANNDLVIQKGRFSGEAKKMLGSLVERIKGE
jgi:inner membrane protein